MAMFSPSLESVDAYIQSFPADIQEKLQAVRSAIHTAIPQAQEKISWQMPTYYFKGNVVHFAAHTRHIGFYPGASGIEVFKTDFAAYKSSKGAVQFPFNEPLPLELIARVAIYRAEENSREELVRKEKKKA